MDSLSERMMDKMKRMLIDDQENPDAMMSKEYLNTLENALADMAVQCEADDEEDEDDADYESDNEARPDLVPLEPQQVEIYEYTCKSL